MLLHAYAIARRMPKHPALAIPQPPCHCALFSLPLASEDAYASNVAISVCHSAIFSLAVLCHAPSLAVMPILVSESHPLFCFSFVMLNLFQHLIFVFPSSCHSALFSLAVRPSLVSASPLLLLYFYSFNKSLEGNVFPLISRP